jgi:hypothetical protein
MDSEYLAQRMGMPVVNHGLHGSLPLDWLLDVSLKYEVRLAETTQARRWERPVDISELEIYERAFHHRCTLWHFCYSLERRSMPSVVPNCDTTAAQKRIADTTAIILPPSGQVESTRSAAVCMTRSISSLEFGSRKAITMAPAR